LTLLDDLRILSRYLGALPRYLEGRMTAESAEERLRKSVTLRNANFLAVLERSVFANRASPYKALLEWAGITYNDIVEHVASDGVEATLGTLYDAGVRVTIDEVKGRKPVERSGLSIPTTRSSFDNPLLTAHYTAKSSGSRGPRTRVMIDLALLEHEAAYVHFYLAGFGIRDRPYAVWRPLPPSVASVKWLLRLEKLGKPLDRWFSHTKYQWKGDEWKSALFTLATLGAGRALGHRFPSPRHVPGDAPGPVVDWLAEMARAGSPATLDTMVSSAVRVCQDAQGRGVDISGTLFRVGGEPLTETKRSTIEKSGCRVVCFYSITELSFVGAPCANPDAIDDVHVLTDKIAVIERRVPVGDASADALIYTTLLPNAPKLMLNVESGDFGRLSTRRCDCAMGQLGFGMHLSHIRSYEKLTSEGMTFLGTELIRLLEDVLPEAFGGSAGDYQFVETEENGLSRISIVASPSIGAIDETAMVARVLSELRDCPGGIGMTDVWTQGRTLRVVRRAPYATASAKILPLHIEAR
jgi:hypothetical protein